MSTSRDSFKKRQTRTRYKLKKLSGGKPRLTVFKSGKHIYAQIIDDVKGITLASASTLSKEFKALKLKTSSLEAANKVGEMIALNSKKLSLDLIVFDKGGSPYHGKVKALADSARAFGLKF